MSISEFLNKRVPFFGRDIPMKYLLLAAAGLVVFVLAVFAKF